MSHRYYTNYLGSKGVAQSLLFFFICSTPAFAADASLEVELSNVRALPFGFTALCEEADLKFKSDASATFVIRDSKLCSATAATLQPERRKWFILCSNDPKRSDMVGHPATIKCMQLEFKLQEI